MSNEIKIQANVQVANGSYSDQFVIPTLGVTQASQLASSGILAVATSATALPVGSVTTLGTCCLRNLDTTNFVTVGVTSGSYIPVLKMKPGEVAIVRLMTGITLQLKADTATCNVMFLLLND